MADRSGAWLFGKVFKLIAEYVPKEKRRKVALEFWEMSRDGDFSPYDMQADEALERCELATIDRDEHGEQVYYEGDPIHEVSRLHPKILDEQ